MVSNKEINKSVPSDRWGEFFDQFSNGNRGRHISIEIINSELGDEELIQNAPLMAIVYDRPGKGDDLVIEVGKTDVSYAHTIDAPTEDLTEQSSSGQIVALSISDAAGTKTIVKLQSS
ncbi:DUF5335 family protein [Oculatella sp. LEGE 06141]|uniref:DUF5335 family protein n=1 Tax=Oculatella sp. LEGE 06141 TaxID=1828648 RepID=UPI001880F0C2|nr:DUF5335 family protein [Oculatella sp. LEGE 06141]MBE9182252.1 DUF5335 family protein [Oculatella sp. LEGE 06141]